MSTPIDPGFPPQHPDEKEAGREITQADSSWWAGFFLVPSHPVAELYVHTQGRCLCRELSLLCPEDLKAGVFAQ